MENTNTPSGDYIVADELALGRANDALGALASLISQASDGTSGPQLDVNGNQLASLIMIIKGETTRAAGNWRVAQ